MDWCLVRWCCETEGMWDLVSNLLGLIGQVCLSMPGLQANYVER